MVKRGSLAVVVDDVLRHPARELLHKWNYKSAIASSSMRGLLFFCTNASAGIHAATMALMVEVCLRFATAGFYGAITQMFRRVEPPRIGTIGALVVLPLVAHTLEYFVHWSRGTPHLWRSIIISVCFTALTTSFNLFAMRQGALVVGECDSRSFCSDLRRMPGLLRAYVVQLLALDRGLKTEP